MAHTCKFKENKDILIYYSVEDFPNDKPKED